MALENEKEYVSKVLNLKHNISEAQNFIKSKYNTTSIYDESKGILYIWPETINESLETVEAEKYLKKHLDLGMIEIKIEKNRAV